METSLFLGMNRAVRGMQYAQSAINVHGSNIAHANDPTYTRRQVLPPVTGPDLPGLSRMRNAFVDDQYRIAAGALGEATARHNVLTKVEDVFGDPVNTGLGSTMDQLFASFKSLSENPADGVVRLQVLSAGRAFAQQVQQTYQQLEAIEETVNGELAASVDQVNTKLQSIFNLNVRISELQRNRMDASDLQDQRDQMLDQLGQLTGSTAIAQEDGTVRVLIGSTPVIDGPTVLKLTLVDSPDGPIPSWDASQTPAYTGKGTVAGLVSARRVELAQLKQDIDTLARSVATQINSVHKAGFGIDGSTGQEFFKIGLGPANIVMNDSLKPEQIAAAASSTSGPRDGENALLLSRLADTPFMNSVIVPGQMKSPAAAFQEMIGWVGSKTQEAQHRKDLSTAHLQVNEHQRQAEFGVSLDEEVANMTVQQKAFAASARVISVLDEMLDTLINRLGR